MSLKLLVLLKFALAAYLTGLIWTVQLVHYPSFALAGADKLCGLSPGTHSARMGWVVMAPMVAELGLAAWLAWQGRALRGKRLVEPGAGAVAMGGNFLHLRALPQPPGPGLRLHRHRWPGAHQLAAHPGLDGPRSLLGYMLWRLL